MITQSLDSVKSKFISSKYYVDTEKAKSELVTTKMVMDPEILGVNKLSSGIKLQLKDTVSFDSI